MSKAVAALGNSSTEGIPGKVPSRPLILASWERSRIGQVDPDSAVVPSRSVSQEDLQRRLRINKALLAASAPHLEWLEEALEYPRHVVFLVDSDGIVLSSRTASSELRETLGLQPGSDISERIVGTNGAGTSLVINQPVTVVENEHFCRRFREHISIGAPVLSSGNEVLGAIGIITGKTDGIGHLPSLIAHSARLIGRELVYQEEHRRAEAFKLLARVLSITDPAPAHLALDELLNDLLSRIRKVLEVDVAGVLLKEPDGDTLVIQTSNGLRKETAAVIRLPGDKQFGRRVIGRCEPSILDDIEDDEEYSSLFRDYGIRSAIGSALMMEDWIIGAICVGTVQPRRFGESHTRLLSLVADRVALAIDRVRSYEAERSVRIEAQATNYAKDEVLVSASQRLTRFLNATLEAAEQVQRDNSHGIVSGNSIEAIKRQATAQAQILANIRQVFHIINGTLKLNCRPVDLGSITNAAVSLLAPVAREKGVNVQTILDPPDAIVSGDAERLQQVVWNLLSNAIKFTATGGHVRITLERVDSIARIKVADTGMGIRADLLPDIFDLFSPDGISQPFKEQGMGLAIARHIVELHQGTIIAESKGEGFGATFTIGLPLLMVNEGKPEESRDWPGRRPNETAQESLTRLDRVSVLIVDNNPDLLAATLEKFGATVRAYATMPVEEINNWRPDVVVSSFDEPNGTSYKLITIVKDLEAERGGQDVPTASLASCAAVKYWMNALKKDSQISIPDPVEPSKLAEAVVRLVHGRS